MKRKNISEDSLFRSAIYSARIEGNPLTLEDFLLPRRREILETIKDHPGCSFDFIRRRFSSVNPKTLHYDMGQLLKKGFILKVGGTRGAIYKANHI